MNEVAETMTIANQVITDAGWERRLSDPPPAPQPITLPLGNQYLAHRQSRQRGRGLTARTAETLNSLMPLKEARRSAQFSAISASVIRTGGR